VLCLFILIGAYRVFCEYGKDFIRQHDKIAIKMNRFVELLSYLWRSTARHLPHA